MFRYIILTIGLMLFVEFGMAQTAVEIKPAPAEPKYDSYQIYLKQPVKEVKELLYEKDCTPINGTLSEGKKTIIMQGYEPGNKVHVKVVYEDGSDDEFVRSPCFIDPVIL